MTRSRADQILVARGLAPSRAQARAAIEAGGVVADGRVVTRASELVADDAALDYAPAHPWVSRGGVKLAHALDVFGIDPGGCLCLDVGAATGGFTQVLLARGAARVYAVDVGRGQLHQSLRSDPRVISIEGTDSRALTRAEIPQPPSLLVCDVSFIGAAKALEIPCALADAAADLVALIKPQFESGPRPSSRAVLNQAQSRDIAAQAIAALDGIGGFSVLRSCDSPILGGEGNLEFLLHARRRP